MRFGGALRWVRVVFTAGRHRDVQATTFADAARQVTCEHGQIKRFEYVEAPLLMEIRL